MSNGSSVASSSLKEDIISSVDVAFSNLSSMFDFSLSFLCRGERTGGRVLGWEWREREGHFGKWGRDGTWGPGGLRRVLGKSLDLRIVERKPEALLMAKEGRRALSINPTERFFTERYKRSERTLVRGFSTLK